ncbi:MAG: hypothetical protein PXY39_12680 [archaeon]|nr:hypothetical protein [archaeon]
MTRIDSFGSDYGAVNNQEFTATTSYRTICVQVTNFQAIKSDAYEGNEGNWQLGPFIADHPFADGTWWNVLYPAPVRTITLHGCTLVAILSQTIVSYGKNPHQEENPDHLRIDRACVTGQVYC